MKWPPDQGHWSMLARVLDLTVQRRLLCFNDDLEVLLLRSAKDVFAIYNSCPHLGKSLLQGRVMSGQITCPFHGACFDLQTGAPLSGPAVTPLHIFPVRIEGDCIWVDLTKKPRR